MPPKELIGRKQRRPAPARAKQPERPLLERTAPTGPFAPRRVGGAVLAPPAQPRGDYPNLFERGKRTPTPIATQIAARAPFLGDPRAQQAVRDGIKSLPDPVEAVHAAQAVAAVGIPLGDLGGKVASALRALPSSQRTNIIAGFPNANLLNSQTSNAALAADAKTRGNHWDPNAGDREKLKAAVEPHHESSYLDVVTNLPGDAIRTPVYAIQGGYALGYAANRAAHGDLAPIKEVGRQQIEVLKHPGAFVQEHPFQAALTVLGGAKAVGGPLGRAAGLTETERLVPATRFPGMTIDRGVTSTNLATRAGEKLRDLTTEKAPGKAGEFLQGKSLAKQARVIGNRVAIRGAQRRADMIGPVVDAAKGISRRRQAEILYTHGLGDNTGILGDYYAGLAGKASTRYEKKVAPLQRRQARLQQGTKLDLTQREQEFLDAARTAAGQRTEMYQGMKTPAGMQALGKYSAKRRAYQPMLLARAQAGDLLAKTWAKTDKRLATMGPGTPAYAKLESRAQAMLDRFAEEHAAAGGSEPFYVAFEKPAMRSEFAGGGRQIRANQNPLQYEPTLHKRSEGFRFASGNYKRSPEAFYRGLARPHTAADAIEYVNHLTDPKRGVARVPTAAERGKPVPEGFVVRRLANVRQAPKQALTAVEHLDAEEAARQAGRDLLSEFDIEPTSVVPQKGKVVLVPKPVYREISAQVSRYNPDTFMQGARAATQIYRKGALFTRPAYPLTNLASNALQAGFEGTGPLSYKRAVTNDIPLPAGIEDAGFISTQVNKAGKGGVREAASEFAGARGPLEAARGGANLTKETVGLYTNAIRDASVEVDNIARRALYIKKALPEARKLAHPGSNALGRWLMGFKTADVKVQDALERMASGSDHEARLAAEKAVTVVNRLLGDFGSMRGHEMLDLAVPFHRWTRFATRLMLQTLPLHYPGRTLLLYRLGDLGRVAQNQMGTLSEYRQGSIPAGTDEATGNTRLLGTQRVNPFATLYGLGAPDEATNEGWTYSGVLGSLNPLASATLAAAQGRELGSPFDITNQYGEKISTTEERARYLAGAALNLFPPLRLAFSSPQDADTSIPLPGLQQKSLKPRTGYQQPTTSFWQRAFNLASPLPVSNLNLKQNEKKAILRLKSTLVGHARAEAKGKALGRTRAERAADIAAAQDFAARFGEERAYLLEHPEELARLAREGF